jgi:hypothetical protein
VPKSVSNHLNIDITSFFNKLETGLFYFQIVKHVEVEGRTSGLIDPIRRRFGDFCRNLARLGSRGTLTRVELK